MKKKTIACLCIGAMLTGLTGLTGCGNKDSSVSDKDEPYKLNVVLKTISSEYWQYVIAGAKDAKKQLDNATVTVIGATGDTAFDEQQNMVETLMASGEHAAKLLGKGGCEIICTQYTDGVADKAVTVMEGVLQTYPEVEAVVCCADDVALGASRAINQAGRSDDGIIICGFDGISSGVQAVIDGQMHRALTTWVTSAL